MRQWFNNHSRASTSGAGRRSALDLVRASKPRLLAAYHAYNAMYKPSLGPVITQEWNAAVIAGRLTEEDKLKPIPAVPINFRNCALKRMLADESPETRAEVEAWRRAQRVEEVKEQGEDDEEIGRLAAANKYHK